MKNFAGVQCEACHGAGNDFKKMSIMKDRDAAIANGLVIPTQATCDGCHTGDDHAKKVVIADNLNNKPPFTSSRILRANSPQDRKQKARLRPRFFLA